MSVPSSYSSGCHSGRYPLFRSVLSLAVLVSALSAPADAASNSSTVVKYLPGYSGELPFYLETGYVSVGDDDEGQMFYFFVESQSNASGDPLLFWIDGGPGCSSLSGFFFESGPLSFNTSGYNGSMPSLRLNPYTWTESVNIVYVDAPIGTGFSYSTTASGWEMTDEKFAAQGLQLIENWLADHPSYLTNELYVGGDSYSGTPIPMLIQTMVEGIENGTYTYNLKGYVLGNPVTDSFIDDNSRIPFGHRLTLISDTLYNSTKTSCNDDFVNVDSTNTACVTDIDAIDVLIQEILLVHVLEPYCKNALPTPGSGDSDSARRSLGENMLRSSVRSRAKGPALWCRNYNHELCFNWANHVEVRGSLNVRDGTKNVWTYCNSSLAYTETVSSVVAYHKNLSNTGLRALIYSGDHDLSIPHMGTQRWIDTLNLTLDQRWRPWSVANQTAGYTKRYTNDNFTLTFATVKGGGHFAAEYKVKECAEMLRRWIAHHDV